MVPGGSLPLELTENPATPTPDDLVNISTTSTKEALFRFPYLLLDEASRPAKQNVSIQKTGNVIAENI